jgi:hypothetical protein
VVRENRSPKSGQNTDTVKKLPTTNPRKRQIAATFTTVASEQIILIEKFTFSSDWRFGLMFSPMHQE